ncbi:MAG TPA: dephospho-CoA kinase [Clostridia bacterium]
MLKIAITGGIACGKTLASNTLADLGACIIDADIIARNITQKGSIAAQKIRQAFGDDFFDSNGELIRRKFSQYVFQDTQRVKLLNSITHPLIRQEIQRQIDEQKNCSVVFVVIPLLVESGMIDMFDRVWVIIADINSRIKRMMRRDNISIQQAYNILNHQASDEERLKVADLVIHNNGSEQEFVDQIKTEYRKLIHELSML